MASVNYSCNSYIFFIYKNVLLNQGHKERRIPKSLILEQNPIYHIRSFWQFIQNAEDFPLFHMDLIAS